jgi:hypothetical protein
VALQDARDPDRDDPRIRPLLGNESPEALAQRLTAGTKLGDPAVRRRLWEGGLAAVQASDDPLIQFLLRIQAPTRAARSEYEGKVQAPTDRADRGARPRPLRRLRHQPLSRRDRHPAPHLRPPQGYSHQGRTFPYATTFDGLWERATGAEPFDLAPRLAAARARIPANTILDVAASTDTIGGSSGSPAVNAARRDHRRQFRLHRPDPAQRLRLRPGGEPSVLVTAAAVTSALRHAYGMEHLLTELGVGPDRRWMPDQVRHDKRRLVTRTRVRVYAREG